MTRYVIYQRAGARRGANTAHTQMGRPTYERHLYTREYTHTNTHKHKQTHNVARQSTVRCGLTPWRRTPHQRRAPRPHPQQAASLFSVAISHAEAMCTARQALCLQHEPRRRRPAHFVLDTLSRHDETELFCLFFSFLAFRSFFAVAIGGCHACYGFTN
jgi:hypothetical protein